MSKLKESIEDNLKQAMRDKNELVVSVLRMLKSAIGNKEISLRKDGKAELKDEEVMAVIKSEVKKHKDSIEAYTAGNRQDLVDQEKKELEILEDYLPEQISDEELEKIVKEIVSATGAEGPKDFGKVMGQVMARLKNQADGNQVGEIVKKVLNG